MIPPRGFEAEKYPLAHKVQYSFGLSLEDPLMNTAYTTLIRHTLNVAGAPNLIKVNPHNQSYVSETGPAVRKMSIIDKMRLSIRINMTANATNRAIDAITSIRMLWRPVFFSFPEKLDAVDDDTSTTVAAILELTKDATYEDVVPLTANKLSVVGPSGKSQPASSVNIVEDFNDYNMTTDLTMENVAHDEDLFQDAIMRYTNKGALKACVGRTRFVNLTTSRPTARFFFNKFLPRSVRRVMPYSFFALLFHLPTDSHQDQMYFDKSLGADLQHVGVKVTAKYHEWNIEHNQDMS